MEIEIQKYSLKFKELWDSFIDKADNGFFFFKRNYMEYHADRFYDYSLIVFIDNEIKALFPCNLNGDIIYSHQGLSYGGVLHEVDADIYILNSIHKAIISYFNNLGIKHINISPIPSLYSKTKNDFYEQILKEEPTNILVQKPISTIDHELVKLPTRRKLRIPKTHEDNYCFEIVDDMNMVWPMIEQCYLSQHGFNPVHSQSEIAYLKNCFPEKILINTIKENVPNAPILAALITLDDKRIVKFQYIGYTEIARKANVIDYLYYKTINKSISENKNVDMGHSIDINSNQINNKILFAKRRHGAVEITATTYSIDL